MQMLQALVLASGLIAISIPASAQWLNYPDPRIPRTADGKPNLVALAPKLPDGTPDFSGIWRAPNNKYLANLAADGLEIPRRSGQNFSCLSRTNTFTVSRLTPSALPAP
jgi:hypothetical protein